MSFGISARCWAALVVAMSALPAWAVDAAQTAPVLPDPTLSTPPVLEDSSSMGWLLARTLVVLGLVVVSIYLVLNVGLRRLMGLNRVGGTRGEMVRVLDRMPLEPKRSLYVVEAAGEFFLVGSSENGLSLVSKLDAAEVQRLKTEREGRTGPLVPFWERLKAARQGGSPPAPPTA